MVDDRIVNGERVGKTTERGMTGCALLMNMN